MVLDYSVAMTQLSSSPNPFAKTTSADFAKIIHSAIINSETIVIFVEQTLCTEDISVRDKFGTPFYNLHRGLLDNKVKYLPQVSEPYDVLNQIFEPQPLNALVMKNKGTKRPRFQGNYKYYYVYLEDDPKQPRIEILRRHDTLMKEVYTALLEITRRPVIGFYTGIKNPIVLEKIKFVPVTPNETHKVPGVMVVSHGAMFRFVDVHVINSLTPTRRFTLNQRPIITKENRPENKLSTRMAYTDFELQFNFTFEPDRWTLDNVALIEDGREVGINVMRVGAPWSFSYICADPLLIYNTRDGSSVVITQYQIQPMRPSSREALRNRSRKHKNGDDDDNDERRINNEDSFIDLRANDLRFGNTVDCGHCFSASILSCLFVTAICLGILLYGIGSLYSVKANDKYDDPAGKPLVLPSLTE